MSAGICIMNRNAIAMAADSAVTVGDHAAIHNMDLHVLGKTAFLPLSLVKKHNCLHLKQKIENVSQPFPHYILHLLKNGYHFVYHVILLSVQATL